MADLGIVPPPPPKFLQEAKVEDPKTDKKKKTSKKSANPELPKPKNDLSSVKIKDSKSGISADKIKSVLDVGETIPEPSFESASEGEPKQKKGLFGKIFSRKDAGRDIFDSRKENIDWTGGDLVEEFHKPKEKSDWDKEHFDLESVHISDADVTGILEPPVINKNLNVSQDKVLSVVPETISRGASKSASKKSLNRKVVPKTVSEVLVQKSVSLEPKTQTKVIRRDFIDTSKIPVRKSHKIKEVIAPKRRKQRRTMIDKTIEQYFKTVEKEQDLIQKELERIVARPKTGLTKSSEKYIIHHNEKLIKSMKHLLTVIQSIDDIKFQKSVQANKKAFETWVKRILEKEKNAEMQRNTLLKKDLIKLFKDYAAGLNKDVDDKKYELSELKRNADVKMKEALKFEERTNNFSKRLDNRNEELKLKNQELNNIINDKVSKQLFVKLKKERILLNRTEGRLKSLVEEYSQKSKELKQGFMDLENAKKEARDLLNNSATLKKLETRLEKKDKKLKVDVDDLSKKERELKSKIAELDTLDKALEIRDKNLVTDIKKLEKYDSELAQRKKELELEIRDFEVQKKHFELRMKEIKEMEGIVSERTNILHHLQEDVSSVGFETSKKLDEVKNLVEDIEHQELNKLNAPKLNFDDYLRSPEKPSEIKNEGEGLYAFNQKIVLCREMITNRQLADAKRTYNQLKDLFLKANLEPRQKEMLYNSIRELYDDIYLSILDY